MTPFNMVGGMLCRMCLWMAILALCCHPLHSPIRHVRCATTRVKSGIRTRFQPWASPSAASCALSNTDIARFTAMSFPIPPRRHAHHPLEHGDEGADVVVAQIQGNRRDGLAGGQ
jgi:hypothetical protein